MTCVADIKDTPTLRKAATLLERENEVLNRKVFELQRELLEAQGKGTEQLALKLAELEQQLAKQRDALFGESSEKRPRQKSKDGEQKDDAKPRGHGATAQPDLPNVEVVFTLDEADKTCPSCGGTLKPWEGQFEESEQIDVISRKFVIQKIRREKSRCDCGACIETAPGPKKLIPGGRYSLNFALAVAVAKYADHLPLDRQARMMKRDGLVVTTQTLWDQLVAVASLLQPTADAIKEELMQQSCIGMDETHWRVQNHSKKRWTVWALCGETGVFFSVQDSRSKDAAAELLGSYHGSVMCDGYTVYQSLAGSSTQILFANCWAHVRRKFIQSSEAHGEQREAIIDLIAQLYEIEKRARQLTPSARAQLRDTESRPVIAAIRNWYYGTSTLPQGDLGKARDYMGKLWNGLTAFLENPDIPLDNNHTERSIRGWVIGRKTYYGSHSRRGTEVAAILYTLIESAKLCGKDPEAFLAAAAHAALDGNPPLLPSVFDP